MFSFSNKKRKIEEKKNNLRILIDYLIGEFYLNPYKSFTVEEITKDTNVDYNIIKSFINDLKSKKMIKGIYNLKLSWDGIFYLEKIVRTKNEFRNNSITAILAVTTFGISILSMFNHFFMVILSIILCINAIVKINKKSNQF